MSSEKGYNGRKNQKKRYQNNKQGSSIGKREPDINKFSYSNYYNSEESDFDGLDSKSIIIGRNPVIESLKAGKLIDSIYVNSEAGGSVSVICRMAREQGIVIKHQGVIAMTACAEYVEIEDILDIAREKNEPPFVIICDEIEDPHNLGAIIRTAEASGAHGVIIPKRRSASLNHTVFKTSAGAAAWVPVARVSNLSRAVDKLKENGVWIYGTDAGGEDYRNVSFDGAVGLVIGSEGFGISRLIKEKCDFLIRLPMVGKITSLNASVAGGIFMYEILKSRIK